MRTKMLRTIEILEDKSNLLREPYPAEIERAKKEPQRLFGKDD